MTVASGTGPGTLSLAIQQANNFGNGAVINIADNLGTINAGALPDIAVGLTINGGVGNTISGQNQNRIFFVNAQGQTVQINNLTLSSGLAQGGAGGTGGAGLGGAVFVNAGSATFSSVAFANNSAKGGAGGLLTYGGGGAGGGLGFAGGNGTGSDPQLLGAGGGGGARTTAGFSAVGLSAGNGGGLHGGAAGPSGTTNDNGSGGTAPDGGGGGGGYDNLAFNQTNGGTEGPGSDFGGGGGGGSSVHDTAGDGGAGGFGGGGGGGADAMGGSGGYGGNGGFGGGGGGGGSPNVINTGASLGGSGGGNGGTGNQGAGGGGAALGGAVFVRSGASVSFVDSTFDAGSLTPGSGGISPLGQGHNGTAGSTAGSALFLMGGNSTFTVSSANATQTVVGTIGESSSTSVTKTGPGTLVLSGANSYSGGTNVSAGTLKIPGRSLPGSVATVSSNAALEYSNSGNLTQPGFTYTGTGTLRKTGAGKLIFGGQGNINVNFSAGALIDVEAGTLVGSSSYQGVWANNRASMNIAGGATFDAVEGGPAGTLQIDELTGSGTFTGGYFGAFNATTTATLGVAGGGGTFSGSVSDDSGAHLAIVKSGSGTETFAGNDSYTGGTTISGGTLVIAATNSLPMGSNVTNNASLLIDANSTAGNVSGVGTTTVAAGATLQTGDFADNLALQLGGVVAAAHSKLNVAGTLSESGTLAVALVNDFKPTAGNTFDLLDWNKRAGNYSNIQLPPLAGGLTWNTTQLNVNGTISVGGVLGDYDHDGSVDAADYVVWRSTLGSTTNLAADGNGNGQIDQGDFDVWRTHFGQTGGSGAGTVARFSVPEPATVMLLIAGMPVMRSRFRSACHDLACTSKAHPIRAFSVLGDREKY